MFQTYEVTARPDEGPPRVAKLRDWMAAQGLDAFIVPRADMYQGEYVAPSDARLAWISGFTGSAGFAVITTDRAALFLDGRYTVQGRAQTDADTFEIVNWPATTLSAWLPTALADGATVGLDPWLHTVKEVDALRKLDTLQIIDSANGVDAIWTDRPAPPSAPMSAYPAALAGRDHTAKRTEIAAALVAGDVDAFLTTQPDAVAWLLNIRGADIERTPIAQAFALIHKDTHVDLICDPAKAAPVTAHLGPDIRVVPPEDAPALLARTPGTVGYDAATCPAALPDLMVRAKAMDDPIALPKACKSEAEIAATKTAHLRDAAAMCRFLRWLDEVPAGTTEIDVAKALEGFRRDSNALLDISFESIVGSGPNGAIVHYRVNEETNRALDQDSVLLVDSGGQYLDGTTDITRTIPLGTPPPDVCHAFTRVLQGMIAVSRTRFPVGVAGAHLDALARAPLWAEHRDYDHGTGHGVGVYLGVHEGPQRISRVSQVPLKPGMILSNEPGYYREGAFGIRIENLITVVEATRPPGGDDREMLAFDTLTWVPIDRRLIRADLLSAEERAWIDTYHKTVAEHLHTTLDGADLDWLMRMTAPL